MGDQSSGKSSVLEALAGIPFPRGSGLVTRCPIRLSMKRSSPGSRWSAVAHASNEPSVSHAASNPDQLTKVIMRNKDWGGVGWGGAGRGRRGGDALMFCMLYLFDH